MTPPLQHATLTPYDTRGRSLETDRAVTLDFNPSTLTIRVSNSLQKSGRRGQQQRQYIGSSSSTLSFEAYFDSTRPKDSASSSSSTQSAEDLDVRRRTTPIFNMLQAADQQREPSPRRVRFAWGSILFDGVIDSLTETLEYFSAEGVPLRSKLAVSMSEQSFEYAVSERVSSELASASPASGAASSAGPPGAAPGAPPNSLTGPEAGSSLGLGASADLGLGLGVDLGLAAGAGIELTTSAALDLFGSAAISAAVGDVDLALSCIGSALGAGAGSTSGSAASSTRSTQSASTVSSTPTGWAPAGPAALGQTAALAAAVNSARAAGITAPSAPSSTGSYLATSLRPATSSGPAASSASATPTPAPTPQPIVGSPPTVAPAFGPAAPTPILSRQHSIPSSLPPGLGRRPSWEAGNGTFGMYPTADARNSNRASPHAPQPPRPCGC